MPQARHSHHIVLSPQYCSISDGRDPALSAGSRVDGPRSGGVADRVGTGHQRPRRRASQGTDVPKFAPFLHRDRAGGAGARHDSSTWPLPWEGNGRSSSQAGNGPLDQSQESGVASPHNRMVVRGRSWALRLPPRGRFQLRGQDLNLPGERPVPDREPPWRRQGGSRCHPSGLGTGLIGTPEHAQAQLSLNCLHSAYIILIARM
jgi:hypothetical protein